jgi:iron complex outermembrane recepter protein
VPPSVSSVCLYRNSDPHLTSTAIALLWLVASTAASAQDRSEPSESPERLQPSTQETAPPLSPSAPQQAVPEKDTAPLPEMTVQTQKRKPPVRTAGRSTTTSRGRAAPLAAPATPAVHGPASGTPAGEGTPGAPLAQTPSLGKTNTKVENLPASVVVVPAATFKELNQVNLTEAVTHDVSGVNVGGPSTYGFFDRYLIRGMDARSYTDSFPDGDQFNGYPHSLNGVSQIEVLKGPGSALFGSTTPGGSINIVHFSPSAVASWGTSLQVGSFGTYIGTVYATGPTGVPGLNYRVDGLALHSDGFRELKTADYEIRPALGWNVDNHTGILAVDVRHIEATPDLYGIPYVSGVPLNVPNTFHYSTPFSHGNQDIERVIVADAWWLADYLTINNRFSFLHRDLDILRNSGGSISGIEMTSRQLREQTDHDNDFIYQFEPVWKFFSGPVGHTLVTGLSAEESLISDNRATADLPNIASIYAPIIPETSTAGLTFLRDATHSGMIDNLSATFLGAYAIDQIDVTDRFKVRLSARQDYWHEELTPQAFVPGRNAEDGLPLEPGMVQTRTDTPFSWSAGALYKFTPWFSPFIGASKSYLTNYNSEATQNGLVEPELAMQFEAGVKASIIDDRLIFTMALFRIDRNNVFAETNTTVNGVTQTTIFFDAQRNSGTDMDLLIKLTEKWKVNANYIIQNAAITSEPNAPTAVGNRPVGVPNEIANAWMTYDFAVGQLDGFRIVGGMTYSGGSYGNVQNTNFVPHYMVWNAVLSYIQPHWDVQVGVKNIFDVNYFPTALSAGGLVGEPRTYFIKGSYHL